MPFEQPAFLLTDYYLLTCCLIRPLTTCLQTSFPHHSAAGPTFLTTVACTNLSKERCQVTFPLRALLGSWATTSLSNRVLLAGRRAREVTGVARQRWSRPSVRTERSVPREAPRLWTVLGGPKERANSCSCRMNARPAPREPFAQRGVHGTPSAPRARTLPTPRAQHARNARTANYKSRLGRMCAPSALQGMPVLGARQPLPHAIREHSVAKRG